MKIGRTYGEYNKDQYQTPKTTDHVTAKEGQALKENSPIKLSEAAQKIQQSKADEPTNAQKVAAIKKAVQEGTYEVSAKAITDSMWQAMKEK
ncbi:flagellar biosynthesis anti-sigma factor FlgM [Enterococcus lemanii]|uniref:Negative regulator of flagellin synthesis n=1 Tax=Enterococcus lemanii TaxID=1159752 RepID=A0ABV9MZ63_9ENTE|nr:flagellar biosynthesis anti-sigma factor FlgM [Enterococcus lemanii]MBM7708087.1 flagellar biosynthesis anti-sigma factor FlgM [Enterococcus lemanii]